MYCVSTWLGSIAYLIRSIDVISIASAQRYRRSKVEKKASRSGSLSLFHCDSGLFPVFHRGDRAGRRTDEQLARTADLLLRIGNHFIPLGDPADGTRHREDTGEQRYRDAECGLYDAGVEIDVRIQFARYEVFIFQRNL